MNEKIFDERVKRIKEFMKKNHLTQVDLTKSLDFQQAQISRYLTGKLPLNEAFCYRLICVYGINPQWLENGSGKMLLKDVDMNKPVSASENENLMRETIKNLNYTINEQREKIERLQVALKNRQDNAPNPNLFKSEKLTYNE